MTMKHLQQQRIKEYFIEAARKLLEAEGVQNITVRKIAEKAGYSYATIYNYFENLDHLLYHVAHGVLQELEKLLQQNNKKKIQTKHQLKKLLQVYVNYYFQRPHLFHFLFFHPVKDISEALQQENMQVDFKSLLFQNLETFVEDGLIAQKDLKQAGMIIIFHLHGMILMYLSGNSDMSMNEVSVNISDMVDYVIKTN